MTYLILILILIIIIFFLVFFRRKLEQIIVYRSKRQEQKGKGKKRIIELINEKNKISNDDVQKLLGVSDATATNYLQELENEGKVKQIGQKGRFVYYELI